MRAISRGVWCLALVGLGWTIGYTQSSEPQFVLSIDAPVGETWVTCESGCELLGARDLGNPQAGRLKKYWYACSGRTVERCGASVAGWLSQSPPAAND
jgi:hypothetical protein